MGGKGDGNGLPGQFGQFLLNLRGMAMNAAYTVRLKGVIDFTVERINLGAAAGSTGT